MWGVTLGLMRDIAPTDALEGMLTAQLVATHNLHMRCHRLAAETESPEKLKDYGNMAAKAGRSFCGLMTTLSRHRGKAPAQVRVEQVNVGEGGQAIVVVNKSGEATATHAPATTSGTVADEPPMRSAHPEANALQIATGSGKDPLPDARRSHGERSADREQECPEAWPLHGGSGSLEAGVSSADAPEPSIDREPVSVADEPVAALVDGDSLPEWSSALLAGPAGPSYFPPIDLFWTGQNVHDLYKRTRAQRVPVSLDDAAAAW